MANEVFGPHEYQIAYDAACPSDNPRCAAQNFPTASATAAGIIVEGSLTQVVKDLRTYEQTYNLPQVPVSIVNAGLPSPDTSGAEEWDLDSQVSTGIAQQVSHLYFYVATTLTDSDLAKSYVKSALTNIAPSTKDILNAFTLFCDTALLIAATPVQAPCQSFPAPRVRLSAWAAACRTFRCAPVEQDWRFARPTYLSAAPRR